MLDEGGRRKGKKGNEKKIECFENVLLCYGLRKKNHEVFFRRGA